MTTNNSEPDAHVSSIIPLDLFLRKKKDKIKKLNVRHQRAATERGQKKKHSIPRACHLFHDDFFSLSLLHCNFFLH